MTFPIVGVLAPGKAGPIFFEFSEVAEQLSTALSEAQLRELGTGPIKRRRSRARPVPYLSNGCVHCNAIQGDFPLHEDLAAFRAEGGMLTDLLAGQVTLTSPGSHKRLSSGCTRWRELR